MKREESFEERLIRNCAATLAGLKTACIYNVDGSDPALIQSEVERLNRSLNRKGIYLLRIGRCKHCELIYVYRKSALERDLKRPGVWEILSACGYSTTGLPGALRKLGRRLNGYCCFPHEIGLFLGFPVEDVREYILQDGQNCKLTGFWKVYGDTEEAERIFARFRKCNSVYCRLIGFGRSAEDLTVAA